MTPNPRPAARRFGAALVAVLALAGCTVAAPGGSTMPDAIVGDDLVALLPETALVDAFTGQTDAWSEVEAELGLLEREGIYIDVESCSLVGLGVEFTVESPGGSRSRQQGRYDENYTYLRAMQFPSVADAEHIVDLAEAAGEECASYSYADSALPAGSYRVVDVTSEGGIRSIVGVNDDTYRLRADVWIQVLNAVLLVEVPVREDAALVAFADDLRVHVAQAVADLAAGPVSDQPSDTGGEWTTQEVPSAAARFDLPVDWTATADGDRVDVIDSSGTLRLSYIDHLGGIGGPGCEYEDVYPYTVLDQEPFTAFDEQDLFFAYRTIEFPGRVAASIGLTRSYELAQDETCETWNIGGNDVLGTWQFGTDWVTSSYSSEVTFGSMDEARAYLDSEEYATLKRILLSLRP